MAPPPLSYPDINGVRTSFVSVQWGLETIPVVGLKEINYEETQDIPEIMGTSGEAIGRPRGTVKRTGSIVAYQKEWAHQILPKISMAGAKGFSVTAWPVVIAYAEAESPDDTVVDTLVGVRHHSPKNTHSEGPDALVVTISLSIMRIKWNGYEALRGAAG